MSAALPTFGQRLTHASQRHRQLRKHEACLQPEHAIAKASELSIATSIGGTALPVARAIDFDHELRLRCDEVDDVATEHHLGA